MSGYLEGVLVLLAINVVYAYAAFLPIAAGQLNLGVAGFAAIGGYASAYLSTKLALSPLIAIPLGGVAAGLVGLAVAVPVLRTRGIYLALATFALGEIVRASILNLDVVGGAAGYPVTAFIRLPTIAMFALGVTVLVWLLFATRFGIAITAVHDDERVADLMGLDVRAFQVAAFTLGSAIAGIGGGLYAHHFSYIEAQYFSISLSISIVLYVLFGGTQSVIGPLLGAAVFTLLPELAARQRAVALRAVCRDPHCRDGHSSAGPDHRRADPPPARPAERCEPEGAGRVSAAGRHPDARQREQALRRSRRGREPELFGPPRRLHRADRAERRRQDHRVQPDHRRLSDRCGPHPPRRRRHRPHSVAAAHSSWRRAQFPEHQADAASQRAGKRAGRPALPEQRVLRRASAGQPRPRQSLARGGARGARRGRTGRHTSAPPSAACPMACRSGSSLCAR